MTNEEKVEMFRMRLEGATLQEVADKFGITREYVRQLVPGIEGKEIKRRAIVYPAILKWFQENELNYCSFGRMCGLSNVAVNDILTGNRSPRKDSIDAILKATGMTYEEAFRKG